MKALIILGVLGTLVSGAPVSAHDTETETDSNGTTMSAETESRRSGWRDGWVIGIGPIFGYPLNNNCPDCTTTPAFGMEMQLGRMLSPRLGLMLDVHAAAVGQSDVSVAGVSNTAVVQGVVAAAVQWWPAQRWWLKGGIGHGEAQGAVTAVGAGGATLDLTAEETGIGMTAASGYELVQKEHFALDLHLRYAGIHTEPKYRGTIVLGLGLAWYL